MIEKATSNEAPIILTHGNEGRGKTSLGLKCSSKPLAFLFERGLPRGATVDAVNDIGTFEKVMTALKEFYTDPGDYESLFFDGVNIPRQSRGL